MAQQLREPTRATFDGSRDWLSSLVETLDSAEHLTQVPCDASALRAMQARLSRPTSTRPAHRYAPSYSPASCNRGN